MSISIAGLDKASVLMVLFDRSKQQGMGFLDIRGSIPLTKEEAQEELTANSGMYFDYLRGRVMKVDISGDSFDPWGFDRDNGQGAAESAIASLR